MASARYYRCEPENPHAMACVYEAAEVHRVPLAGPARCTRHGSVLLPLLLGSIKEVGKWLRAERARRSSAAWCPRCNQFTPHAKNALPRCQVCQL